MNNENETTSFDSIDQLIDTFFNTNNKEFDNNNKIFNIKGTNDELITSRQYRFPHAQEDEIIRQVDDLLKNRIVYASLSPYNTPLWIVPKKWI